MTTPTEAYEAGVDAVIANNSANKGAFADAIRTVVTQAYTDAEAKAWIDELALEYNRVGQINATTYASMRSKIIADGKDLAMVRFEALAQSINQLPETKVMEVSLELIDLRSERDEADANIDILIALKSGQPKQVKDAIQLGIEQLRGYKREIREQIQNLTGDPDS